MASLDVAMPSVHACGANLLISLISQLVSRARPDDDDHVDDVNDDDDDDDADANGDDNDDDDYDDVCVMARHRS